MRLFNFFAIMFLLVGALAFSACTDTETVTETVTKTDTEYVCADGSTAASADECPEPDPAYDVAENYGAEDGEYYEDGDRDGMIQGTDIDDLIKGEGGNDSIKGMGGDDKLDGGAGNDTLDGGAGDDELTGGMGDDTLKGGDGTADIAVYNAAMQLNINLATGKAKAKHADSTKDDLSLENGGTSGVGTDTLTGIENVSGTAGDDTINGDDMNNLLIGNDGADMINGKGGDDTIIPNRRAKADGTANVVDPNNTSEVDGIDVVDGGAGSDTISYEGESSAVTINLGASTATTSAAFVVDDPDDETDFAHFVVQGLSDSDRIKVVKVGTGDEEKLESTIENVTGGIAADTLTGDARANVLTGGPEGDTLNGEPDPATATIGGDDMLNGGGGNDTLNGGPGNDTLNGGDGTDVLAGNAGDDTINGGDNATGETETLSGGAGADTLNGGGGTDTLNGGTELDTYIISKGDPDTIGTFEAGESIHLKGFSADERSRTLKINVSANTLEAVAGGQTPNVTLVNFGNNTATAVDVDAHVTYID